MSQLPFVTVVVPCRNEERHVAACLESIVSSDYPREHLEVLVVDGDSSDSTPDIVRDVARRYPFIRLLRNPERITPTALNVGIAAARGEVIVRMDAHATFPEGYIRAGVEALDRTKADLAGGPIRTRPGADTLLARAIALATSHPFGVGNSRFRVSTHEGFVDTVPFGAFRRSVFERVGHFDARLSRNQDNELNSRIRARGGTIYLTPAMTADYYSRATLRGLVSQAFGNGRWNVVTITLNPGAFRIRHFAPFALLLSVAALAASSLASPAALAALATLVALYVSAALVATASISLRQGVRLSVVLPLVFASYHAAYALGTAFGIAHLLAGHTGVASRASEPVSRTG